MTTTQPDTKSNPNPNPNPNPNLNLNPNLFTKQHSTKCSQMSHVSREIHTRQRYRAVFLILSVFIVTPLTNVGVC